MNLSTLFNPRSVAVIGASGDSSKVGYALIKNLVEGAHEREVYPVTLNATELFGRHAYRSVHDIPGPVDLAVIAVRADMVPTVLRECAGHGVQSAVVISAGFKEIGPAGQALEEELATVAREHGMSLLGPNCLGILNTHTNLNATFAAGTPRAGHIGFLSQSGALGTALLDWAYGEGIGFSSFVSLGNEAVLTESDFLEYIAGDDETRAVLLYLEQVRDGERFLEAARSVAARKPLVVLRAGRSARGGSAVSSHTGALAPVDEVFSEALRGVGAIEVDSIRDLYAVTTLLQQRITKGSTKGITKICVLTNGGGPSINTADLIERSSHLTLSSFDEDVRGALRAVLPPVAAVGNPVDVIGDAGADRFESALRVLTSAGGVDAVLGIVTPQMMTKSEEIAEVFVRYSDARPIIPVLMGGAAVSKGVERLRDAGLSPFSVPSDAVRALDMLATGIHKEAYAQAHSGEARKLTMLNIDEMRTLLTSYGLTLEGEFVREGRELSNALAHLGPGPYVIKAISQELVHKSDLRAVQLGLPDQPALERAWGEIYEYVQSHTPGATINGMLVQRMVRGVETIIGMKRDSVFGPVVLFGLGGIFVEVLKDASLGIAPLTKDEALARIRRIKGLPLLTGARGREPVNLDALAEILVSLSTLALAHPEVEEIDFNPVFATPDGVHIVDARVMV